MHCSDAVMMSPGFTRQRDVNRDVGIKLVPGIVEYRTGGGDDRKVPSWIKVSSTYPPIPTQLETYSVTDGQAPSWVTLGTCQVADARGIGRPCGNRVSRPVFRLDFRLQSRKTCHRDCGRRASASAALSTRTGRWSARRRGGSRAPPRKDGGAQAQRWVRLHRSPHNAGGRLWRRKPYPSIVRTKTNSSK